MGISKEKLEAIAEADEEVKKGWSQTQLFIAKVVGEVREELEGEGFDGGKENGVD